MAQQAGAVPSSYEYVPKKSRMQQLFGRDWQLAFMFIAPIVILMLTLVAWPFIKAIYTSMTIYSIKDRTSVFVGFDNYIRLYSDVFYRQAVKATVIFTSGAILFKLIFGTIAALLLHSQKRGRTLLTGLILLPWIVPSVVQALTWRSILEPIYGGLNPILFALGIIHEPIAWLSNPNTAMASVIMVNVWAGIPFFTVNILAGLSSIDAELYEAAQIDGANAWQRFTSITLPGLRFVIAVATLLSTIWTFNNFETIWLLTQGGPGNITKVYSILAYQKAMGSLQFGPGTAVAFSLTPVLAFFIIFLSRYMRRDVSGSDEADESWQDKVLDAIGWTFSTIGSIILWIPLKIIEAVSAAMPKNQNSRHRSRQLGGFFRGVALALLLIFILAPFYWIIITSFKSDLQISQRTNIYYPNPWTLDQFRQLFFGEQFWTWFWNSTVVSVFTTALAVAVAALGAYALARLKFWGAQSMQTILLITYLLPAALMFIPLYGILADLHIINTRWALIVTYPTGMIPFASWLMMGYYQAIPEELEHAAMVDGATRLQAFLRVTLPLTTPALLAVTLFSFTHAWKEYLYAFVFISSNKLYTLPVGLAQTIFGDIYPWGVLMAASLIISVPVVVFYMWGQRFMVAGLTAGSVKG